MTEKFVFGPLQTRWLEALESGKYAQTDGTLRSRTAVLLEGEIGYCCLGVANEVCELGESWEHDVLTDTFLSLGLHSAPGGVRQAKELTSIPYSELTDDQRGVVGRALASMNDNGATFEKIASAIRANPTDYFWESK